MPDTILKRKMIDIYFLDNPSILKNFILYINKMNKAV